MGPIDDRGSLYQLANRLAHLYWLREALPDNQRVEAWLINVLFADDVGHIPTSADDLESAMQEAWAQLGLKGPPEYVAEVVVPASDA